MQRIYVQGMHGLGDNLHQRAIVRHLAETHEVWLETPWPSVYHDLPVRLVRKASELRTQAKNAQRERDRFEPVVPSITSRRRVWYTHNEIRRRGGFLRAMCHDWRIPRPDFSLTIPPVWRERAQVWLDRWQPDRPLLIYRPLVDRREWSGCQARNPEAGPYVELLRSVRERFFVVSVADLVPKIEWTVSPPVEADAVCHAGELEFEVLAALVAQAGLVWCSPGFMLILAQAVRAPMVAVFGGHESARLYDHGYPENLFIEPIQPCECFSKIHPCRKTINCDAARRRLETFLHEPAEDRAAA